MYTPAIRKQALVVFLTILFHTLSIPAFCQVSGLNDPTFNPGDFGLGNGDGANGNVWANLVQSDGKILIGGEFTRYNGTLINRVARLQSDGTLDPTFTVGTGANSGIRKMALQSDGKIIICGSFTSYNGTTANRIARLNTDGSLDASFNTGTGFNNSVYAVAIQNDGKILAGGLFTQYNGTPFGQIVRLNSDGSIDASYLCTGANNQVSSLALQPDGKLVVGGAYSTFNGTSCNMITRLNTNGTTDNSFSPGSGTNGVIRSLSVQPDGKIILGGVFTMYNGSFVNRLVRIFSNGSLDASFATGSGPNNTVIWSSAIQPDGKIIAGGDFTSFNGTTAGRIIRLNTNGSVDASFNPLSGASGFVLSLSLQPDGKIITGGDIATYDGYNCNHITRLNLNGTLDQTFNTGTAANNSIHATAIQPDGKILIGGAFTRYSGTLANHLSRLYSNGSVDASFAVGNGVNDTVNTLVIQPDGKVLAGGAFTNANGSSAFRICRLGANGTNDASFITGAGFNGTVYAMALQSDGKILVGGNFSAYNGAATGKLVRLNASGSLDASFVTGSGFDQPVDAIAIQTNGSIVVAGDFTSYNGSPANKILRLSSSGAIDASFNTGSGANNTVSCLAIQSDGKIIAGGNFSQYNGVSANRIIRLNSNGTRDNSFAPVSGPDGAVYALSLQSDARVVMGGAFSNYDGVAGNRIVRINTDGSRDLSFSVGAGAEGIPFLINGNVYSTAIQTDNKVLIAGGFVSYRGTGRNRIARIQVCDGPAFITGNTALCAGSSATYSVAPVAGATSYNWMMPSGWTGSSTSNTISVIPGGSGSFSVSVSASCGLTGPASLSVSVKPLPPVAAANASICLGQSHTIVPSGALTYTFSSGSNTVSPVVNSTYTISGTGSNGCIQSTLSHVTVNPLPVITVANGTVCTGSSYTIVPSGALSYTYSTGSSVVSPISNSNYTVGGTDANGCVNSASLSVSVNPLPNIQLSTNGSLPLCAGTAATLTASGGQSYAWYETGLIAITNTLYIAPVAPTNYTLVGTDANGCTNTVFFHQSIHPLPSIQASSSQSIFCAGTTISLTATGGQLYTWFPNGPVGTTSPTWTLTPASGMSYTVEGTDVNGCKNSALISTTVNALPVIQMSASSPTLCAGKTVSLTASGAQSYTLHPGAQAGAGPDFQVSPTANTTYTLEGVDINGCLNVSTLSLSVSPKPSIQASAMQAVICQGNEAILTASGGLTYNWAPGGPTGTSSGTIAVSPTATTNYTVEGFDNAGCSNTATVTQSVSLCAGLADKTGAPTLLIGAYPNPAGAWLSVYKHTDAPVQLSITDMLGKMVYKETLTEEQAVLSIDQLADGLYILKAEQQERVQVIRVLKQKE